MTAPSIISHGEAREIVGRLDGHAVAGINTARGTHWGNFAADGRITATLAEEARQSEARRSAEPWQRDGEPDALWERLELSWALYAYVAHHGERGAVEAGYRVTVTPGEVARAEAEWAANGGRGVDLDRLDSLRTKVSRQEVATLDEAQARVDELIEECGGSVDEYPDVTEGGFYLDVRGSTITVEKTEGWGSL